MKKTVISADTLDRFLPPAPPAFEEKTLRMLRNLPKEERIVKRKLSAGLVLALALILALAGLALAAINWGSRDFVTHTMPDGTAESSESVVSIIQPVGQTFESDTLRVDVIDAAYDGRYVVLAWTIQNKTDMPLYLTGYPSFNGEGDGAGGSNNVSNMFIQPGETRNAALSTTLVQNQTLDADTCEIKLRFIAMKPTGPIVERYPMDESGNYAREGLTDEEVNALLDAGNVVVEYGDWLVLSNRAPEDYATYEDLYAQAGVMEKVDALTVAFTLERNADVTVGKPLGTQALDFGEFTLRLGKAEMTPGTVSLVVEAVFRDKAAADRHAAHPLTFPRFTFLNEDGKPFLSGNWGIWETTERPVEQSDGTYVWGLTVEMMEFYRAPRQCRILPGPDCPLEAVGPQKEFVISFEP